MLLPKRAENNNPAPIRIIEVAPRDGLQNEPGILSTDAKVSFINALSETGVAEIEVGSFVSARAIPQLADSDEVFRNIKRRPGVVYSALVPNERGLARANAAAVDKIAVFTAASDRFTQRNIHCTVRESIERFKPVVAQARQAGMAVRGYISTATHCPFEGSIAPSRVTQVMQDLLELGVEEISLGDTIGKAAPNDVRRLMDAVMAHIAGSALSLHFHDTYGLAVANVLTAWMEYGITSFDTSAGGFGGCPYAPGASGNVATEDVVYALRASGASVGVDERRVVTAARQVGALLNHPPASRLSRVPQHRTASEACTVTNAALTMTNSGGQAVALATQARAGNVRAVSRLITLLESRHPDGIEGLRLLNLDRRTGKVIGVTGYPGAGKSTLISGLVAAYRRQGRQVAVLAVDVSSAVTGGALLGDRIRMREHALDSDVYIRSMATRGHHGGLARTTDQARIILEAAGYDVVLIETVGVGQNEADVVNVAPIVVAVVAPGLGDEVQAMKAGLLEQAHIIVVNKADHPGAGSALRELREWFPMVISTVATTGEGLSELLAAIVARQQQLEIADAHQRVEQ